MLIFSKMRKNILRRINVPEGIEVEFDSENIILKKGSKLLRRNLGRINVKKDKNEIVIEYKNATKKEKKEIMTLASHIKNMIDGLSENFVYKLQVCVVHFPVTVAVEKKTNELIIKNFLGERVARKAKIRENVDVNIEKDIITVKSHDIEAAGQTAANIEKATKIRKRDRRIFQDGIFITEKPGRKI